MSLSCNGITEALGLPLSLGCSCSVGCSLLSCSLLLSCARVRSALLLSKFQRLSLRPKLFSEICGLTLKSCLYCLACGSLQLDGLTLGLRSALGDQALRSRS